MIVGDVLLILGYLVLSFCPLGYRSRLSWAAWLSKWLLALRVASHAAGPRGGVRLPETGAMPGSSKLPSSLLSAVRNVRPFEILRLTDKSSRAAHLACIRLNTNPQSQWVLKEQ